MSSFISCIIDSNIDIQLKQIYAIIEYSNKFNKIPVFDINKNKFLFKIKYNYIEFDENLDVYILSDDEINIFFNINKKNINEFLYSDEYIMCYTYDFLKNIKNKFNDDNDDNYYCIIIDNTCSVDYYNNKINNIKNKNLIIILNDDNIDLKLFNLNNNYFYIDSNNLYFKLILSTFINNLIISNSLFSFFSYIFNNNITNIMIPNDYKFTINNYVSCDIIGGLGNQLFQIAITLEYSKKYNKIPIFKERNINEIEKSHEITDFSLLFNNNLNIYTSNIIFDNNYSEQIEYKKNDIPYYDGNLCLHGYFQSPYYISDEIKNKMNDLIYSNKDFVNYATNYYNFIKKNYNDDNDDNYIFIHFRKGDFVLLNFYTNIKWYYDALMLLKGFNKKLIIFSDDINWCKNFIKFNNMQYFIDNINNRYIELILMSLFNNGIVSPGSSFSYWGAFIGKNKNIIVSKIMHNFTENIETNKYNQRYPVEWIEL